MKISAASLLTSLYISDVDTFWTYGDQRPPRYLYILVKFFLQKKLFLVDTWSISNFIIKKLKFPGQKNRKTRDFEKNEYQKYGKNSLNI